ncbi:hypothetical protein [Thermodesulfovibrio thiophilus]|uniref:hypothetical protein n=1 Tax=Thermodesulfovibrio thiophilus TaxID=340095 RepID=UPI00146CD502|nr:hypothetical protein [Thermodesulfovibrio thiophilus]
MITRPLNIELCEFNKYNPDFNAHVRFKLQVINTKEKSYTIDAIIAIHGINQNMKDMELLIKIIINTRKNKEI